MRPAGRAVATPDLGGMFLNVVLQKAIFGTLFKNEKLM